MPFSKLESGRFTLDEVRAMQVAFDMVCVDLKLEAADPRRSDLATAIIERAFKSQWEGLAEYALSRVQA